ncbi:MAG TPA: peptidylprolyl isomerase [Rhizomicrobium sp.]|nr:peptidylprolyl isomerase [Rhizomicrobium sp.]
MRIVAGLLALLVWAGAADAQTAKIETSLGTITVVLDAQHAPKTVANFVAYAKEGHFDGTCVYRVVPGFVIQMGSYDAGGDARPTHATIPLESANGLRNVRGTLAMARGDDPDSADAEFFINLSDNSDALDPKPGDAPNTTGYAVFGRVTGGMDTVDKIAASVLNGGKGPFPDAAPAFPVVITKVTVGP